MIELRYPLLHFYSSPVYEPHFPSHISPPTFLVSPSNQLSLNNILDAFNSTVQHCKQEINEGIFKQDSRVIFFFQEDSSKNIYSVAKSIFAPNSYFRSMSKVAIAYVSSSSQGAKIIVYRHVSLLLTNCHYTHIVLFFLCSAMISFIPLLMIILELLISNP